MSAARERGGLAGLGEGLADVSYPTIGHFLEDGFLDPAIRSLLDGVKVAGPAVTVRIAGNDAYAMNRALLELYPGAVLVVDMSGDHRHAPVGAVTAAAATAQGAAGVVVDGVATDILELRATGLPVFARGTSCLTTKRVRSAGSAVNVPVQCGGIQVTPGDWVWVTTTAWWSCRRRWQRTSWAWRWRPMPPNRRSWPGSHRVSRWNRCWLIPRPARGSGQGWGRT